jgi:hypothetical protein
MRSAAATVTPGGSGVPKGGNRVDDGAGEQAGSVRGVNVGAGGSNSNVASPSQPQKLQSASSWSSSARPLAEPRQVRWKDALRRYVD